MNKHYTHSAATQRQKPSTMSAFDDEEDNNPFAGSDHLFASGIASSSPILSARNSNFASPDHGFLSHPLNRHHNIFAQGDHSSSINIFKKESDASNDILGGNAFVSDIFNDVTKTNELQAAPSLSNDNGRSASFNSNQEGRNDPITSNIAISHSQNQDSLTNPQISSNRHLSTITTTSPVRSSNVDSSPESWINYRPPNNILIDNDASIIDNDKQEEYERGLIDQANTTISSANPLDFYSDTETTPLEILSKYPNIQIDIPYIIQLKDKKNKIVIVYIIKLKNLEIRRRYSDFDKLRKILAKMYPTFLLPSLPEKHSFKNYMRNPLNVQKSDVKFIENRKRALRFFLNRVMSYSNYNPDQGLDKLPPIKFNMIFLKFLDPTATSFQDILKLPPVTLLQKNPLLNDPLNPFKISPYHNLLPTPLHSSIGNYDQAIKTYRSILDREKRQAEELRVDTSPKKKQLSTSERPLLSINNDSSTSLSQFDFNKEVEIISFDDFQYFKMVEKYILAFSKTLKPIIDCESDLHKSFETLIKNLSTLGAYFNAFSLEFNFTMTFQPDFEIPKYHRNSGKLNINDTDNNGDEGVFVSDDDIQRLKQNLTQSQNKDFEQLYALSSAIEKVGQSIDNEFINIEMLEYSLMTNFQEPLMEINAMLKNTLNEVMRFKKLKDLQYLSINKRLRDKKKLLQQYFDIDLKYQRLEEVLKRNLNESNTMKQAYQRLEIQKQKQLLREQKQSLRIQAYNNMNSGMDGDNTTSSINSTDFDQSLAPGVGNLVLHEEAISPILAKQGGSFSWLNLFTGKASSPETMTRMQRNQEIKKLKKEIMTLQHLASIAANDVKRVSEGLKENIKRLIRFLRLEMTKLNHKFAKIFLKFLQENLSHWVQVNDFIKNNIYDLKFNYKYDNRLPRYVRFPKEDLIKRQRDLLEKEVNNGQNLDSNKNITNSNNDNVLNRLSAEYLEEQIYQHNSKVTPVDTMAELVGSRGNTVLKRANYDNDDIFGRQENGILGDVSNEDEDEDEDENEDENDEYDDDTYDDDDATKAGIIVNDGGEFGGIFGNLSGSENDEEY